MELLHGAPVDSCDRGLEREDDYVDRYVRTLIEYGHAGRIYLVDLGGHHAGLQGL